MKNTSKFGRSQFGLRARLSKCAFFKDSVQYLGHIITKKGIQPVEEKVTALVAAPTPESVEQLQSF